MVSFLLKIFLLVAGIFVWSTLFRDCIHNLKGSWESRALMIPISFIYKMMSCSDEF